jgi:Nickel responsive protein SCO4226-like
MAEFLVELYVPGTDVAAAGCGAKSARLAAEELSREGTEVTYLQSIFVPEDETCFFLYEAAAAEDVEEAARRASIPFERIAEALTHSEGRVTCTRRNAFH